MKIYRVRHNIENCLKIGETMSNRYFSTKESANYFFMLIQDTITGDEFVELDELEVVNDCGEIRATSEKPIACHSDDTKFGFSDKCVLF